MTTSDYANTYRDLRPKHEQFCARLKNLLEELLSGAEIQFHVVEARAKTAESFHEKATREGKTYKDPFKEITDLSAARIIVYYQDDIDRVAELLDREFNVDPKKSVDKRESLAPDQFGYLSVHKIVSLSSHRIRLAEWRSYKDLVAEIQIRTVLQHAWAAIDHALKYKGGIKNSDHFARRLVRLAGLLELADEEFKNLKDQRKIIQKQAAEQVAHGNLKIAVDSVSIVEFIRKSSTLKQIGELVAKTGFRAAKGNNSNMRPNGIRHLLVACNLSNINSIEELERELGRLKEIAQEFFTVFMKDTSYVIGGTLPHIAAMLIIGCVTPRLDEAEVSRKTGWSNDYAKRVLMAGETSKPRILVD